jgi:hypothetical protein
VTIFTRGNDTGHYTVAGSDPAEAIRFDGQRGRVKVPPGTNQTVELSLAAKQRSRQGRAQSLPFEVQVTSTTGRQARQDGQLVVQPLLPAWAIPLAGSLVLLVCISTACLFSQLPAGKKLIAWFLNPSGEVTPTSVASNPSETPPETGGATSTVGTPGGTPTVTLPPSGTILRWRKTAEDRAVIETGQEFWEKYQAGTSYPGLYLRTDTIEAFGDFLELNSDQTFMREQAGVRTTGTWKIEVDQVILSP